MTNYEEIEIDEGEGFKSAKEKADKNGADQGFADISHGEKAKGDAACAERPLLLPLDDFHKFRLIWRAFFSSSELSINGT